MIFSKAKGQSRGFIFTKRTQSEKGIFATALAIMSLVSIIINIYFSYKNAGDVSVNIGVSGFLALIFALIAFVYSIIGMKEPDSFRLFPILGLVISVIDLSDWGFCIYLGVG